MVCPSVASATSWAMANTVAVMYRPVHEARASHRVEAARRARTERKRARRERVEGVKPYQREDGALAHRVTRSNWWSLTKTGGRWIGLIATSRPGRTCPLNRDIRRPGWCYADRPHQVHGSPRPPTSACDHMKLQTFFDGPVWRYAAGFAGSAMICGSAYY